MPGAGAPARRLPTRDLKYELPEDRIAIEPAHPRDSARLLVVDRASHTPPRHAHVRDLVELLRPGDLLIVNETRVLAARFLIRRSDTHGLGEGLYVAPGHEPETWVVLLKLKRQSPGVRVEIVDGAGAPLGVELELLRRGTDSNSTGGTPVGSAQEENAPGWLVRVHLEPGIGRPSGAIPRSSVYAGCDLHQRPSDVEILDRVGLPPLPPYILAARKHQGLARERQEDRGEYQTVYAAGLPGQDRDGPRAQAETSARGESPSPPAVSPLAGSVAAPTAGLHFTPDLLRRLEAAGVERHAVTLHVGLGTFKPVETEFVEDHPMHAEWCTVPRSTVEAIARLRRRQAECAALGSTADAPRLIAVGTTSARTLESFSSLEEMLAEGSRGRWTRLLVTPGHAFRHTDALLTNFHLPGSTLMSMVAAFLEHTQVGVPLPTGIERLKSLYALAIEDRYRFYSFGDAMLIV